MLGFLMEHLLDNYQGVGVFSLNDNDLKMGLKEVVIRIMSCLNWLLAKCDS